MTTLKSATSSVNAGVALATPTIYLQVELLYALFSASIPALNRWLRNFDTSMGSTWIYSSHAYSLNQSEKSQNRSRSRSIPMADMDRSSTVVENKRSSILSGKAAKRASLHIRSEGFVPAGPKYVATTKVYRRSHFLDGQGKLDVPGMNSEEMIIRKDVGWQVQHEDTESVARSSS